jgi:hypothetical protein
VMSIPQNFITFSTGDSGGPLFVSEKMNETNGTTSTVAFLIGAVSRGRGCGRMNYPGIYSRIRHTDETKPFRFL